MGRALTKNPTPIPKQPDSSQWQAGCELVDVLAPLVTVMLEGLVLSLLEDVLDSF